MKALVYGGPGRKDWTEKEKPAITKPTDAIVRITKTTICGTDLHILKGDVPRSPWGARWATRASASWRRSARRCGRSSRATGC